LVGAPQQRRLLAAGREPIGGIDEGGEAPRRRPVDVIGESAGLAAGPADQQQRASVGDHREGAVDRRVGAQAERPLQAGAQQAELVVEGQEHHVGDAEHVAGDDLEVRLAAVLQEGPVGRGLIDHPEAVALALEHRVQLRDVRRRQRQIDQRLRRLAERERVLLRGERQLARLELATSDDAQRGHRIGGGERQPALAERIGRERGR
jgi:hypothetical protein